MRRKRTVWILQTELANLVGVTPRQIHNLEIDGVIHKSPKTGKYDKDGCIKILFEHYRERYNSNADKKLKEIKAQQAELDLKERLKELISFDKVKELIIACYAPLRQRIDEQSSRISKKCNPSNQALAYEVLEDDNTETLTYAQHNFDTILQ